METNNPIVTVKDPLTGDTESRELPSDDYILICGEELYLANAQVYKNGTHVITIKAVKK